MISPTMSSAQQETEAWAKRSAAWMAVALALVSMGGCKKEERTPPTNFPDKVVFGYFQSPAACFGEQCIEIFSMESGKLMEDTMDQMPTGEGLYTGDFSVPLSMAKYQQITAIFQNQIPDELLQTPSGQLGMISQWNTNYYFEYHRGSFKGYWVLDGSFGGGLSPVMMQFLATLSSAAFTASAG